jgi:putative salt-induced outer membrane protein
MWLAGEKLGRLSSGRAGFLVLALALAAWPSPIAAAELPADARSMLVEAYPKERQSIVNVLKRLYPDSGEEIDALVRQIDEQKKAQVERMGLIEGLRGEVAIGGYYSTGNTKEWGVAGTAALRREGKRWVHSLDVLADLKSENGERTSERLAATYFARRNFLGSNWFATAGFRYERDPFAGFSRRFGQFVGAGYQIANNPRLKWDLMAGPGMRETRPVDEPSNRQFGLYARTTFAWQVSDTLKFGEDLSAAVGKGDDTYLSTTSLTSDVYGGFALRLSFITEVETKPPADRKKIDTYSRASVVYVFQPH